MTYSLQSQLKKFGINGEVILMDFTIATGANSVKLPTAIMRREGLDLSQEGVKSKDSLDELFKVDWVGETVVITDHHGEEVELVRPGDQVSLGWGRNILTALAQWIQEQGEFLDRKNGWMFSKERVGEVMRRVAVAEERRDQILQVLMTCYDAAHQSFDLRVDSIELKLNAALEAEAEAAQAKVDHGGDELAVKRLASLQRQSDNMPEFISGLRSKFPSRSELRAGFIFSNTVPRDCGSILSQLQGNTEAINALVAAESAGQGESYAQAVRNGLGLMAATVNDKLADISSQFYGHIAEALGQLEGLGRTHRFGPKVAKRLEAQFERLEVLGQLLAGFQRLGDGSDGTLDQVALMDRLELLREAFAADAGEDGKPGNGREELIERLAGYRQELQGVVAGANLASLGIGAEQLLDWVEEVPSTMAQPVAPITYRGGVGDRALMI